MRRIGLHMRLEDTLLATAQRAHRLGLRFFQCFFVAQATGRIIKPTDDDVAAFLAFRKQHFDELILHGSYWINLAGINQNTHRAFQREVTLAKRLTFTHMVLHCGSAKGALERRDGIDALARSLNELLAQEDEITILLENTAHAGLCVGSDIRDFGALRPKLKHPQKIKYCIDVAHAFLYGYDITSRGGLEEFVTLLEHEVGIENIALLHLNDSRYACGSRIDCHELPGDGAIGTEALKSFVMHPKLQQIPILIEPPELSEEREWEVLERVRGWFSSKQ